MNEPSVALTAATLRRPMRVIDAYTGQMECRVCRVQQFVNVNHGGGSVAAPAVLRRPCPTSQTV